MFLQVSKCQPVYQFPTHSNKSKIYFLPLFEQSVWSRELYLSRSNGVVFGGICSAAAAPVSVPPLAPSPPPPITAPAGASAAGVSPCWLSGEDDLEELGDWVAEVVVRMAEREGLVVRVPPNSGASLDVTCLLEGFLLFLSFFSFCRERWIISFRTYGLQARRMLIPSLVLVYNHLSY